MNMVYCPFRAQCGIYHFITQCDALETQGVAIGLGYIRLSAEKRIHGGNVD
jgi:hypothetical protein